MKWEIDEMGVDEMGNRQSGMKPVEHSETFLDSHMSGFMRKPAFCIREKQRCRSAPLFSTK